MYSSANYRGIVVPVVTPVTAEGALDEASAERLIDHVAGNGCSILVLGTTGEVASLDLALRRRYVEIAVRAAARRVSVFACIAHNALADSIALGRAHLQAGADAVVGMLPNYFKLEPSEMESYFGQLASATPGPLLLYNMPQTTGMSLPIEVIERLSQIENIAGLKDSENSAGRRELVAERLGGRADFALFMGVAAQATAAFKLGFVGVVPSSGNLFPAAWRALYDAALAGDWGRVEGLQQKLDALNGVLQRNRSLGQSLAALKAALSSRGLCQPHMLPPLKLSAPSDVEALVHELAAFGSLS